MRLAGGWDDEWFGLEYPASSRICRGDRARLNAREGPGALSAGRAWKMAARWHELVEAHERPELGKHLLAALKLTRFSEVPSSNRYPF